MKKMLLTIFAISFALPAMAMKDSPNPDEWFARAKVDLEDAHIIFNNTAHYDQVCFLSHQAVEKGLKGMLIAHGIMPDHTHYTVQLAGRCSKFNPAIKKYVGELHQLDRSYVPSRYPRTGFTFSKDQAVKSLETADSVYQDILTSK